MCERGVDRLCLIMIMGSRKTLRLKKSAVKQVRGLGVYFKALKRGIVFLGRRFWRKSVLALASCCKSSTDTFRSAIPYQRLRQSLLRSECIMEADYDPLQFCSESVQIRMPSPPEGGDGESEDVLVLKVAILGDSETGKTSFMESYTGVSKGIGQYVRTVGIASMEKIVTIQNTQIVFSLWELGGYNQLDMLPDICQDTVALLFTFDLTQRSTLHSIKQWFLQARVYNKNAVSILIGTKYDQFVNFPYDIQLAILQQAMHYAQTMGASLFFSSVTHNINVQKIFKVILSKLFDLPCNIPKNRTFGEPIVDF